MLMQKWTISQGLSFDKMLHAIIDCTHRENVLLPRTNPLIGSSIQIGQTALKSHSNKPQYKWTQQLYLLFMHIHVTTIIIRVLQIDRE